jgi:hypothetical protein
MNIQWTEPALAENCSTAPHRIIYRLTAERLEILTIIHAARQFPSHSLLGKPHVSIRRAG